MMTTKLAIHVIILSLGIIITMMVIPVVMESSIFLNYPPTADASSAQITGTVQILSGTQIISKGGTANFTSSSSGQSMSLTLPSNSSGILMVAIDTNIADPTSEIGSFEIEFLGDIWNLNLNPFDACIGVDDDIDDDNTNNGCYLTFTFTDDDLIEAKISDFLQAVTIFQDTQKDGVFAVIPTVVIDDIAPTYTALATIYFTESLSSLFGVGVFDGNVTITTTYCSTPITQFDQIINGTNSSDVINGTNGNDLIFGFDGNDVMYGNNGDDCIIGGLGDDVISGGNGADRIYGNMGDDIMYGGNDFDIIYGNENNDIIYGNNGDDYVMGNTGNDTMYGGRGNDVMYGGLGDDFISGDQGGADVCVGNNNNGTIIIDCEL